MSPRRAYVEPLMRRALTGPYRPTHECAAWWFNTINREVFDSELPPVEFRRLTVATAWAMYYPGLICLRREFETKQQFVAVLAHEMVHHWQRVNRMGHHVHGASFLRWRNRFRKHGMRLEVHGDVHF